MTISEFETRRYEKILQRYVESRRPQPHIRPNLDLGFRIRGQSVEIFEIQPVWRGKPGEKLESSVAKATYVKLHDTWKLYWQLADRKWHRYDPDEIIETLEEVLAVVDRDEYGCFYG